MQARAGKIKGFSQRSNKRWQPANCRFWGSGRPPAHALRERYAAMHPEDPDCGSLANWRSFEREYAGPLGMFEFLAEKPEWSRRAESSPRRRGGGADEMRY